MFILGLIDSGLGKVAAKLLGVDQEELQEIRASLQKLLDYLNELLRKLEELKKKWQTNVAPLESVM
jgi:phosphoserine phosphatase